MFSSCQGPRTAEHVVIPPPLSIYALFHNTHTLAHTHTYAHSQTSLFSFGIRARTWPWPDCWGGSLSNSPEGDPIMWHPSPSLTPCPLSQPCMSTRMRGRRRSLQACVSPRGPSFSLVIAPKVKQGRGCVRPSSAAAASLYLNLRMAATSFHSDCADERSRFSHLLDSQSLIPAYVRERSFHVQSELAARMCVIAVAFPHSPQLPRCFKPRWLTVSL